MHKQEFINKYTDRLNGVLNLGALEIFNDLINDLKKLDGPEKVTIPQFVADWITHSKNIGRPLFGAMSIFEENTEIKKWMQWAENQETFALAWIDGYEVEKEKRYRVRLKGLDKDLEYLNFKHGHVWVFSDNIENEEYRTCHTKKELEEADFGWVFDCEGIEIEEVEE